MPYVERAAENDGSRTRVSQFHGGPSRSRYPVAGCAPSSIRATTCLEAAIEEVEGCRRHARTVRV